jgi:hypothetical protein
MATLPRTEGLLNGPPGEVWKLALSWQETAAPTRDAVKENRFPGWEWLFGVAFRADPVLVEDKGTRTAFSLGAWRRGSVEEGCPPVGTKPIPLPR